MDEGEGGIPLRQAGEDSVNTHLLCTTELSSSIKLAHSSATG